MAVRPHFPPPSFRLLALEAGSVRTCAQILFITLAGRGGHITQEDRGSKSTLGAKRPKAPFLHPGDTDEGVEAKFTQEICHDKNTSLLCIVGMLKPYPHPMETLHPRHMTPLPCSDDIIVLISVPSKESPCVENLVSNTEVGLRSHEDSDLINRLMLMRLWNTGVSRYELSLEHNDRTVDSDSSKAAWQTIPEAGAMVYEVVGYKINREKLKSFLTSQQQTSAVHLIQRRQEFINDGICEKVGDIWNDQDEYSVIKNNLKGTSDSGGQEVHQSTHFILSFSEFEVGVLFQPHVLVYMSRGQRIELGLSSEQVVVQAKER
ncbi:hypothetical protein STEG23_005688 [Scotinomys teguina]